jgi:hypothetical protein
MRVVTFRGGAVKRQRKISDNTILVVFYSRPPMVVTPAEWETEKQNMFYDASVKRREIVRSL